MKVYDIIPVNNYSCQKCLSNFKSNNIYLIEPGVWPCCSNKCEFGIIYHLIKNMDYSDETLKFMQCFVEKKAKIFSFNKNSAIFSITKYYMKVGLSNIKVIGTRDRTRKEGTTNLDTGTRDKKKPPYEIGGLSLSLSPKSPVSKIDDKKILSPKKGGLAEWF